MGQGQGHGQGQTPPDLGVQAQPELQDPLGLSGDLDKADAYLLLRVPDFGDRSFANTPDDRFPGNKLTSFLRLGAFKYADEPASAKFLLGLIPQAGSPGDPARGASQYGWDKTPAEFDQICANMSTRSAQACKDAGNRDVFFLDDVRKRPQDVGLQPTDDPGHGLTMRQRQLESSKLYSRGGWRDHSDGNRLSTTYGDKVEVVRGNYKMIVLGRQDDPGQAQGWEATGGNIQDYAPGTMPGASYWLEWIPDYQAANSATSPAGVWLLCDTTENVYAYARTAGNLREENWGDVHESYVGSENPPTTSVAPDDGAPSARAADYLPPGSKGHEPPTRLDGLKYDLPGTKDDRHRPRFLDDNAGMVRSNPHIIEKTWARRIDTWTGSEACRVPDIVDTTYAVNTNEYSNVSGNSTSTTVAGTITESTSALNIAEATNVAGGIESTTEAGGTILENTVATTMESFTTAGGIAEFKIAGGLLTTQVVAGLHVNLDWHTTRFELAIGARLSLEFGAWYEVKIGPHDAKEIPDKNETTFKKVETSLESLRSALTFNASALNFQSTGVKLKMVMGKIDLGL